MNKKILIVDDDPRNIYALTATLRSRSFDCKSCEDAESALELLKSNEHIDIVFMDMMMPDMDGYEAIPLLKQIPGREKTPVISVTAQAMVGDKDKCLDAGADGYISKPINVDELLDILKTL